MTSGVQLLSDLREVFGEADRISTEAILQRLHDLPESPWADIYGKPPIEGWRADCASMG
jgi:hypothetical protein